MSGIAGTLDEHGRGSSRRADTQRMLGRLRHRGPDGSGWAGVGGATLGHTRLGIGVPRRGAQPLFDRGGSRALVLDGEVYNWRRLTDGAGRGSRSAAGAGAEALIPFFDRAGPDLTRDLDGTFAFAVADGDRLVLGRDPIGMKPLFMGRVGGAWHFASEMKALAGGVSRIEAVPPGHVWDSAKGLSRYYRVPRYAPRDGCSVADHGRRLRRDLEKAVEKRLMGAGSLGGLLSGGLDSSIVAALAARRVPGFRTFSVGLEGSPDLAAARQVAGHLGSDHHELTITPADIRRELPKIVYHLESFDRDLVRSAIPNWFVARFAAEQVEAVLIGEGADELLAGYAYHRTLPPDDLAVELTESIHRLHKIGLQRVDRMTMAHGLEARAPFLDTTVVATSQQIPVRLKLRPAAPRPIEKWILRIACEDLLPAEIVWRRKAQFDEGTGVAGMAGRLGTGEEALYRRLFADAFPHAAAMEPLVARWGQSSR